MRLLEGDVEDPRDTQIADLEEEIRELKAQLSSAHAAVLLARNNAALAMSTLRRQLSPLYRALQAVFGELDAAGVEDQAAGQLGSKVDSRVSAVWEAWKQKLSPACGKIIDALLTHSELNSAQLKVACRLGTSTVSDSIYKLNKAGLINKNAGRFSLKQL